MKCHLTTSAQNSVSATGPAGASLSPPQWLRAAPGGLIEARVRAKLLRKVARDGGDPLSARDQVFRTRHPEVIQAVNDTLELLKNAGVVIDDAILARLGVTE